MSSQPLSTAFLLLHGMRLQGMQIVAGLAGHAGPPPEPLDDASGPAAALLAALLLALFLGNPGLDADLGDGAD